MFVQVKINDGDKFRRVLLNTDHIAALDDEGYLVLADGSTMNVCENETRRLFRALIHSGGRKSQYDDTANAAQEEVRR